MKKYNSKSGRRDFLIKGTGAIGWLALSPTLPLFLQKALAQSSERNSPHYFVLFRAVGGAHSALGLDPFLISELTQRKIDPIEIDTGDNRSGDPAKYYAIYKDEELLKVKDTFLGIAAQPLVPLFEDLAIVNGVMLLPKSPFHDACLRYSSSGRPDATPAFPFQLGKIINRAPRGVAYNGFFDLTEMQKQFGTTLSGLLKSSEKSEAEDPNDLISTRAEENHLDDAISANAQKLYADKGQASGLLQLQNEYARGGLLSDDLATLAAGLNCGLVEHACVEINPGLDTHGDHRRGHPIALNRVFTDFANCINAFKKIPSLRNQDKNATLFDDTTFMLVTDFSRSAWRQGDDGTDHNPFNNSMLLAGKNIVGGQKIGASVILSPKTVSQQFSRLQAMPFNFTEQRVMTLEEFATDDRQLIFDGNGRPTKLGQACSKKGEVCVDHITPGTVFYTLSAAFGVEKENRYFRGEKKLTKLIKNSRS